MDRVFSIYAGRRDRCKQPDIYGLLDSSVYPSTDTVYTDTKGAITSKIKHAIKHKTSPARLAVLLQPLLAFCFSLQPSTKL